MTSTTAVDDPAARQLRDALASSLVAGGWITSERVETAFRVVPRHGFAPPGGSLEAAYADDVMRTKYRWSGIVLPPMTSHADLYLWLAGFERNFCHVTPHDDAALPGDPDRPGKNRYPSALIRDRSLSYLTARMTPDENWEFGACAYGPNPEKAVGALLSSVADWNRHGRDLTQDAFGYWPEGATPEMSSTGPVSLLPKRFGVVSIRWPAAQPDAT